MKFLKNKFFIFFTAFLFCFQSAEASTQSDEDKTLYDFHPLINSLLTSGMYCIPYSKDKDSDIGCLTIKVKEKNVFFSICTGLNTLGYPICDWKKSYRLSLDKIKSLSESKCPTEAIKITKKTTDVCLLYRKIPFLEPSMENLSILYGYATDSILLFFHIKLALIAVLTPGIIKIDRKFITSNQIELINFNFTEKDIDTIINDLNNIK